MTQLSTPTPETTQVVGDRESFVLRPAVWAGGASDVGLCHAPNQDAVAMAAGIDADGARVAVACVSDGVSTSPHAEDASALAVETACGFVTSRLREGRETIDMGETMTQAFVLANEQVVAAAGTSRPGTWACTMVMAVLRAGSVTVGNVGDSRCYWVPDDGEALALSTDDSLAQAQIDLGVEREVAEASSGAHAITKWLGPGSQTVRPSLTFLPIASAGWLVTCSDGLWNYASAPQALAQALDEAAARAAAVEAPPPAWAVCCELVDWANQLGGHDNITVTLLRLEPDTDPGQLAFFG